MEKNQQVLLLPKRGSLMRSRAWAQLGLWFEHKYLGKGQMQMRRLVLRVLAVPVALFSPAKILWKRFLG